MRDVRVWGWAWGRACRAGGRVMGSAVSASPGKDTVTWQVEDSSRHLGPRPDHLARVKWWEMLDGVGWVEWVVWVWNCWWEMESRDVV